MRGGCAIEVCVDGQWRAAAEVHADGALPDARTRRAWLMKLPRSSRAIDRTILRARVDELPAMLEEEDVPDVVRTTIDDRISRVGRSLRSVR